MIQLLHAEQSVSVSVSCYFKPLMITHFNATVSAFSDWVTQVGMQTCLVTQNCPSHVHAAQQTKGQ